MSPVDPTAEFIKEGSIIPYGEIIKATQSEHGVVFIFKVAERIKWSDFGVAVWRETAHHVRFKSLLSDAQEAFEQYCKGNFPPKSKG